MRDIGWKAQVRLCVRCRRLSATGKKLPVVVAAIAREMGAVRLLGEYLPTAKNTVVAALYPTLGFTPAGDNYFVRTLERPDDDLVTAIAA